MKSNVLFLGDTHGNLNIVNKAVEIANKNKSKYIVQVGDFGYFPLLYPEFIQSINTNTPLLFIDGNHDDHWNLPHSANEVVHISLLNSVFEGINQPIYYIPRGYKASWGNKTLLFLGGAKSIDKQYRTLGLDYWTEEEVSYRDYVKCISQLDTRIDVLVTHTAPRSSVIDYVEEDYSSSAIEQLVTEAKPSLLIHGHHHIYYELQYNQTTKVIGLDSIINTNIPMDISSMTYILELN